MLGKRISIAILIFFTVLAYARSGFEVAVLSGIVNLLLIQGYKGN